MRTYEILTRTTYGESMVDSMLKGIVIALDHGTFPAFSYKLLSMTTPKSLTVTKHQLQQALFDGVVCYELKARGIHVLNTIELESGSRNSWNLTGYNDRGVKVTAHVYTID